MFILDTNVVSEVRILSKANARVLAWTRAQSSSTTFLSSVTLFELEIGVLRLERKDGARGKLLRSWLDNIVLPSYSGRIFPIDAVIARMSASFQVPRSRPDRDTFIAATSIVHGMTVVTRNVADFQIPGVRVFNPWTA